MTQDALGAAIGVDGSTVQNLESARFGRGFSRVPSSAHAAARYFGWTQDSVQRILAGGDPTPDRASNRSSDREPAKKRDLPLRVVDELESDDPLIDSQVIQLPGIDGARMTVVVRGNPDATPEEIQKALLAWRRAERNLQRPPDGDDDEPQAANGA